MKITAANIYVFNTGSRKTGGAIPVIVELETDAGITGIGEIAITYGRGSHASAMMIREILESYVLGKNPLEIRAIWEEIYCNSFWTKGGGAITFAGISAVEMALWDITGKALNVPIYQLMGGKIRDKVRVYANWGMSYPCPRPEDFGRRACEVVEDGYDALKFYPLVTQAVGDSGRLPHIMHKSVDRQTERRCIENIKAVRKAVGDDIDIAVDVSGDASVDVILRIGKAVEECDLYFFEEPVDPFDTEGHKTINSKLDIPLAAGERLYTLTPFRRLLETRSVHFVQPDPGVVGGLQETMKIGALSETYNIKIAPHNCAGPILTAACLQLAACLPNFAIQEIYPYRHSIYYEIVDRARELDLVDSYWKVDDKPGLGVNLNHSVVDKYQAYRCEI